MLIVYCIYINLTLIDVAQKTCDVIIATITILLILLLLLIIILTTGYFINHFKKIKITSLNILVRVEK